MPLNYAPKANPANTIIEKVNCNPNSVVLSSLNNPIPNNPTAPERSESKPKNACKSMYIQRILLKIDLFDEAELSNFWKRLDDHNF